MNHEHVNPISIGPLLSLALFYLYSILLIIDGTGVTPHSPNKCSDGNHVFMATLNWPWWLTFLRWSSWLQDILLIIGSVIIFGEQVTPMQVLGKFNCFLFSFTSFWLESRFFVIYFLLLYYSFPWSSALTCSATFTKFSPKAIVKLALASCSNVHDPRIMRSIAINDFALTNCSSFFICWVCLWFTTTLCLSFHFYYSL